MTAAKTTAPHKATPAPKDAIALLKADHEAVSHLFTEYEKTHLIPNKKALVAQICTALSVHAQIEDEIFYPAVKAKLKDKLPALPNEHGEKVGMRGGMPSVRVQQCVFDQKRGLQGTNRGDRSRPRVQ